MDSHGLPEAARGPQEPIAIVGCGNRFAGNASGPTKFWELLLAPYDLSDTIPDHRFSASGFFHPDGLRHGTSNITKAYTLSDDYRNFDAAFFGISPVEAESLDPQQRQLLEVVFESLESAGLTIDGLRGSDTAVYVGVMGGDYADLVNSDIDALPKYHATGTSRAILSNRISYFFDWRGPSLTIDTACSSSLVSLHHAVQILRSGQSRIAVAAGANLILSPAPFVSGSKLNMLSPTGHSRMWDSKADGYARGDGFASVVVKTLSNALADGDNILSIIRETGVNQDGRTKGITVPSASAQASLIRDTYARAGLDIRVPAHRPQYFESHGTGTPAGDPIEANAIFDAFFGSGNSDHPPLYVGSVKTVIGHTEGTAGLAGIIKASLALQEGTVPPNLHFEAINPAIEPYYGSLRVPTASLEWPDTYRHPRRASVNSFGFGGTNAHAILEAYQPNIHLETVDEPKAVVAPFTFSAASHDSLIGTLQDYVTYMDLKGPGLDADALARTLHTRRSALSHRASFTAADPSTLRSKIVGALASGRFRGTQVSRNPRSASPSCLGVFTGQGAQWANMGRELLMVSGFAAGFVQRLDRRLADLPDRPSWSLTEEILADGARSRVNEAAISQPLCTAVQLLLVELLRAANVTFDAVVGHSSGEIAAAYAAGAIKAPEDAVVIAYYRGLHSGLASGLNGEKGAMLAAGLTPEGARALCESPGFEGRLVVAAINSPTSVTLSGDEDAVLRAKDILEDEDKFVRLLRVDKAYHSHHMDKCSSAYSDSLKASAHCQSHSIVEGTTWYSSVFAQEMRAGDDLHEAYWVDNMVKPVRFAESLQLALSDGERYHLVIEVGPHPALQSPLKEVLQALGRSDVVYTGTLRRQADDIEAMSECLGTIWCNFSKSPVDMARYTRTVTGSTGRKTLADLPTYRWDHTQLFWHESRVSRAFRSRSDPVHGLLGTLSSEYGVQAERVWRNRLNLREMPWLEGHRIQGQAVFPAAAYVCTAFEAARHVAHGRHICSIEVQDVKIGAAIALDDGEDIETLFALRGIEDDNIGVITATWSYRSAARGPSTDLVLNATGRLILELGEPDDALISPTRVEPYSLVDVPEARFYSAMDDIGYNYSDHFKGLHSLKRRSGFSTGSIRRPASHDISDIIVHPATLDAAIQSILLAFSWPGDGRLRTVYYPVSVDRIHINPQLCSRALEQGLDLRVNAQSCGGSSATIQGDVDVLTHDGTLATLQIEGMVAKRPEAGPSDDVHLFSRVSWGPLDPDAEIVVQSSSATSQDYMLAYDLERIAFYFLRQLACTFATEDQRQALQPHHVSMLRYADHVVSEVSSGVHQYINPDWTSDDYKALLDLARRHPESIDVRIMFSVGENLTAVMRGESTILEHLLKEDVLSKFYVEALGICQYTTHLGHIVGQIVHRYPNLDILEVGAGTGGATRSILKQIGNAYASYVFTDVSSGFFPDAADEFSEHSPKLVFQTLDLVEDPCSQAFDEHSFDLIVASLVLHATPNLDQTLRNVRRLLKPGGYLVILEITNLGQTRLGFIFGGLQGWWSGADDGRTLTPCITAPEWDSLFRRTGYSEIQTMTPDSDSLPFPFSVMVTQASDGGMQLLRRPLDSKDSISIEELTVLGGSGMASRILLSNILGLMRPFVRRVQQLRKLRDALRVDLAPDGTLLGLVDLDEPMFQSLSKDDLEAMKRLLSRAQVVFWVSRKARESDPRANMTLGFLRTLALEFPRLRFQHLDLGDEADGDARVIVESLLRLEINSRQEWSRTGDSILWTAEPEMAVREGRILVPRLKLHPRRNARYNSSSRKLYESVDLTGATVSVNTSEDSHIVHKLPRSLVPSDGTSHGLELVRVIYSSLFSLKTPDTGSLFLVLAYDRASLPVVTFSTSLQSHLILPRESLIGIGGTSNLTTFMSILWTVVSRLILGLSASGETLLILDPPQALLQLLTDVAIKKGVTLHVAVSERTCSYVYDSVLHPRATLRTVSDALPSDLAVITSFSTESRLVHRLKTCRPNARFIDTESLFARQSRPCTQGHTYTLNTVLKSAVNAVEAVYKPSSINNLDKSTPAMTLNDLSDRTKSYLYSTVIDWQSSATSVSIQTTPVDTYDLFAADKTYWLIGLTKGLGLSLASWMINKGAVNIVLSSRNPCVEAPWLEWAAQVGANVRIFSCDISKPESVRAVFSSIVSTLPPIGGIAQGAMTLRDSLFSDLSVEQINDVLAPKVQGSQNLEDVLGGMKLDFMVYFSSLASVIGNVGQSHYAAANAFMAGLAARRRAQGLAASVIHIGAILGNGYVTRELTESQQRLLLSYGFEWMSEQDFHQIFAEAVISSGVDDNGTDYEIMAGLRLLSTDAIEQPTWYNNPKFSHLVAQKSHVAAGAASSKCGVSVRDRLANASTDEEVLSVMQDTLITKLQTMLRMNVENDHSGVTNLGNSLHELGIDSLMAVELRTWFEKEFGVDIPVLKILGGSSIADLLVLASSKIQSAFVPRLRSREDCCSAAEDGTLLSLDETPELSHQVSDESQCTSSETSRRGSDAVIALPMVDSQGKDDQLPDILKEPSGND